MREQLWIFGVSFIQGNNALTFVKLFYLVVDVFNIVAFISKKGAFCNREKTVRISQNIQSNGGIANLGGCSHFINGKSRNTVYKDMIFISPVEFIFLFNRLVGSSMNSELTVLISFWLVSW
ncbi:hypothetical protein K190097F3_46800 [Enterocloster clostridioformis]